MRTPSPPTSGCYARASPPLPWPAALGPVPPPDGAFTRWTKNPITRKLHNSHTWLPRPPPADQKHIDVLVVGDSYADPHDMAFFCWPDVLARTLGLTALNAARGGSRSDQTVGQLERALAAAAGHGLCTSGSTVLIVHTGGNDALQLLLPLLLLLILDLHAWPNKPKGLWPSRHSADAHDQFLGNALHYSIRTTHEAPV